MQAERGATNSHIVSDGSSSQKSPILSSSASISAPSSFSPSGVKFIEHRVSKMDTLAGVAIKYGVEVADIKRANGLVTDIQMFAHKSLQIPLPGKHPPTLLVSNGSTQNGEKSPPNRSHYDILNSLESLKLKPNRHNHQISPAMCGLQSFYGFTRPEMALCNSEKTPPLPPEKKKLSESSPTSDPILRRHRKSHSLVNVASLADGDVSEDSTHSDRSIRRRQKADAEPLAAAILLREKAPAAEPLAAAILLKVEGAGGMFPGRTGKCTALRPKTGSMMEIEASRRSSSSVMESLADVFVSVRKSSSTSNLSEPESSFSAIWGTSKRCWKPDGVVRPIFDGLPKPIISWKNKAALD
ncbi:LOW QUALITY PROTEIN: lysM and putative peptidoglycan-binding domain-containing protein 1-like [Phalaenopsis equestris]|uniref:LOW QUALITY PROTEIN: lysM and putative peptidoglycan-binding domain-containing protein 1-like n=1 Tax=Phalaenopsis equestris TaxID=78828 RepID=UPI0009E1CA38|nr:LOW QUALITY PROTEIN: lysM and putative peptidoglycan-binding domain-containing protein 1-like [Phalaenopsis equestris]